jgi:hypothetical protein
MQKCRERTLRRMETLGSRRRSMVIQIVKYSVLSVLQGKSLSIEQGTGLEVQGR